MELATKTEAEGTDPSVSSYTPQMLVAGMRQRDKQICAVFFDRYVLHVNRLVKRFLGPDQDQRDVVNTVFLEIFHSVDKIRDPQSLSKWVTTVTVQTVLREIRRRKYQRRLLFFSAEPECYYHGGPNQKYKLSTQLFRVLRKFPADEHAHFVLYYVEGYTYEEIAALTGRSLSSVKRIGKRFRSRFSKLAQTDVALAKVIEDWKNA